jgi:hypothetical protein
MATLSITTHSSLSPWLPKNKNKNKNNSVSAFNKNRFGQKNHLSFSLHSKSSSRKPLRLSVTKDEQGSEPTPSTPSSVAVVSDKPSEDDGTQKTELGKEGDTEENEKQQEMDWKTDEEFKKFMGNPSIEAAIKLEKKRADRKLKELDRESSDNPLVGFFYRVVRDSLTREKERLEKAEETFKALDLNKVNIVSYSEYCMCLDIYILVYWTLFLKMVTKTSNFIFWI